MHKGVAAFTDLQVDTPYDRHTLQFAAQGLPVLGLYVLVLPAASLNCVVANI